MNRTARILGIAGCLLAVAAVPSNLMADSGIRGLEIIPNNSSFSIVAAEVFYTNPGKSKVTINWIDIDGTNLSPASKGKHRINRTVEPGRRIALATPMRNEANKPSTVYVSVNMDFD